MHFYPLAFGFEMVSYPVPLVMFVDLCYVLWLFFYFLLIVTYFKFTILLTNVLTFPDQHFCCMSVTLVKTLWPATPAAFLAPQ